MDVGFQLRQISGPRVRDAIVNQYDNQGGNVVGITADILSCDGRGGRNGVLLTLPTFPSVAECDVRLNHWLERFHAA